MCTSSPILVTRWGGDFGISRAAYTETEIAELYSNESGVTQKTASVGGDLAAVVGTPDRARIEGLNGGLVRATVCLHQ
jgi:hypothetical protein